MAKNLADKIKSLKIGESFNVVGVSDRMITLRTIRTLRDAGILKVKVITKDNKDGTFKVAAI